MLPVLLALYRTALLFSKKFISRVSHRKFSFSKWGKVIMFIDLLNIIQPLLVSSVELLQIPAMVSAKHCPLGVEEQKSGLVVIGEE